MRKTVETMTRTVLVAALSVRYKAEMTGNPGGRPDRDAFCQGALEIREAWIRGRLLRRARLPGPRGPGRGRPRLRDRRPTRRRGHTGAPVRSVGIIPPSRPRKRHSGRLGRLYGEMLTGWRGVHPGCRSLYHRVLSPVWSGGTFFKFGSMQERI